jgi:hypothetical protein
LVTVSGNEGFSTIQCVRARGFTNSGVRGEVYGALV